MGTAREKLRPFVPAAAGAASGLGACLVFLASAGERVPPGSRAAAAACGTVLLAALVLPALSIAFSRGRSGCLLDDARRWARVVGGAWGGTALGILAFTLAAARPAFLAVLASLVVVDTCVFSFGALARALGKAFRSSVSGGLVAGAALLGLGAAPFWSKGILASSAGAWVGGPLIGASPFLAVSIPWSNATAVWTFNPRVSGLLYRVWIGTDFPVRYPSWVSCAVGHAFVGAVLLAAAEVPRLVAERRRDRRRGAAKAGDGGA